ncbi:MAG: hypothetical protein WC449_05940 [Candidatus Paceibacterota bacterium]
MFSIKYFFNVLFSAIKILGNEMGGVGVNSPYSLPAQSQLAGFDSELRMKSVLASIYTDVKGLYNTEKKTMSAGIYMEISEATLKNAHTGTITMMYKLRQPGVMGNAGAIGQEELPETKAATIYRNNCRKVTVNPEYGVRKLDTDYLDLRKKNVDNLGDWNKDEEDLEIHQSLVEQFGETLRYGDTAATCVPNWNHNTFVAGLDRDQNQPVYSSNSAVYSGRIVNAFLSSGNGSLAPIPTQTWNQPNLSRLSNFALRRRISTIPIPGVVGNKGYILTMSEYGSMYLGDPVWSARNLGSLYIAKSALSEKVQNWTGVLGAYKDILLVQDVRLATVLPSGTSEPYSMVAGYMWHGDTDLRHYDHPDTVRECNILHGMGAVWKWYPEKIHFIEQLDDYGAIKGIGTACVRACGSLAFDQQIPGVGTHEQFSSILAFTTVPDYV